VLLVWLAILDLPVRLVQRRRLPDLQVRLVQLQLSLGLQDRQVRLEPQETRDLPGLQEPTDWLALLDLQVLLVRQAR
jgi:hypothetical protein